VALKGALGLNFMEMNTNSGKIMLAKPLQTLNQNLLVFTTAQSNRLIVYYASRCKEKKLLRAVKIVIYLVASYLFA
jgi:hypothetical protein